MLLLGTFPAALRAALASLAMPRSLNVRSFALMRSSRSFSYFESPLSSRFSSCRHLHKSGILPLTFGDRAQTPENLASIFAGPRVSVLLSCSLLGYFLRGAPGHCNSACFFVGVYGKSSSGDALRFLSSDGAVRGFAVLAANADLPLLAAAFFTG